MVPLLKSQEPASWRKDWLYEYYEYPGEHNVRKNRGVRTDRYKYIHYYEAPEEFELYDLKEKCGELHNLYDEPQYTVLAQDLRQRLGKLRKATVDNYIYQEPAPRHGSR